MISRSQRSRGLRRGSTAARLLGLWVRIPPGAWMSVCVKCCVLSGRGLCDELITRPEKSYRLCCVDVCDLETSTMRRPWPALGRRATGKKVRIKNQLIPNVLIWWGQLRNTLLYKYTIAQIQHNYTKEQKQKRDELSPEKKNNNFKVI